MSEFKNVQVSRDETTWETEIRAEIPAEAIAKYRDAALKDIQKTAKLDGFRQGHAPIDRIVAIYGESAILRQAAERAAINAPMQGTAAPRAIRG